MNKTTTSEQPTPTALASATGSVATTRRRIHMCQSIEGPLMNWGQREWKQALKYMNKEDGSPFSSVNELKQAFLDELAKGHKVVPIGDCDNFDWEHGCKGHPINEPQNS